MKKVTLILFLSLISVREIIAQYIWMDTVVDTGVKSDIVVADDRIFIAYMHEANNGFVKCATISPKGDVKIETVANGYFYGPLDIDADINNFPRIVYHDHNPGDLAYAFLHNGQWTSRLLFHPGHDGWDASIFVDDDNISHILSVDPGNGIEYANVNGDSSVIDNVHNISTGYKYATDIIVQNSIIHTTYHIESTGELYYSYREDGIWSYEKVADNAFFPSMSLDSLGDPAVAFYTFDSSQGRINFSRRKENKWVTSLVMNISDVEITFLGARKIVDLEYANNQFCIAINNKVKVWYGCMTNDEWAFLTPVDHTDTDIVLGQQISMVLGQDGSPHLSYFVRDNSIAEGGEIHYLKGTQTIDSTKVNTIHLESKTRSDQSIQNVSYQLINDNGDVLGQIESNEMRIADLPNSVSQICPSKSDNPVRDLSALDIVKSQRLVLGISEHCKEDFIAGDVNKSGQVSAADLILSLNVILGKASNFPDNESWRFYQDGLNIEDLSLQEIYESGCFEIDLVRKEQSNVKFIGVKLGDIKCEKQ